MNTLREQQRRFSQFVLTDEGQSAAVLPELKPAPSKQFSDEQRLQIYRNNFAISLREALAAVYPVVHRLVGEEFFQYVAREYVQRYPSHCANLHEYGDSFADFLAGFTGLEAFPYLPDVARLEWAYHQVFHTAENRILNLEALAELQQAEIADVFFTVSTGCVFQASAYPVLRIWQTNQNDRDDATVSLEEGGVQYVVVRHGGQVEIHPISEGLFELVATLANNKNFAQACEDALAIEADCDIAAALQFFVEQKIVVGFYADGNANEQGATYERRT